MAALRCVATLAIAAFAHATRAPAEPLALEAVPKPLAEWTDWVLRGHEQQRCPFLARAPGPEPLIRSAAERFCAWPAQLELELDASRGRFAQRWQIFARSRVPLPGGENRWPLDVQVDGRPAPVVVEGARATVELDPGIHSVSGSFAWDALPETLAIPTETALVSLRLNGRAVELPDRDEPGRLWLERRSAPAGAEANRIEIDVHRRVIDEIPLQLDTRIELRVAGRSREALLGNALPAGFVPMALEGALPARLDPDGRLRVQLRPGSWSLELRARHTGRAESLAPPAQPEAARADGDAQWDAEEIWVFEARPQLRSVEVGGAPPVDPNQTSLPAEWRQLPAFLMGPGTTLQLTEKRRGDAEPAPDELQLERSFWLDFDGRGFTLSDRITGVVRRSSRLEMRDPIELGRVSLDGSDQFITRVEGGAGAGVEVPLGAIDLSADSRANQRAALSAVSWNHDFQGLSAQLWLPPGWRLIHASGVDRATATWLNRWTLLDLFVVLISAIGVYRLWGTRWGVVAIAALAIGYTEPNAPRWLWVAALVGEALRRALPEGRLSRLVAWYRAGALGLLLLAFVSFGVEQLRIALHPVLERAGQELMSQASGGFTTPVGFEASSELDREVVTFAQQGEDVSIEKHRELAADATQRELPPENLQLKALGYAGGATKRSYRPDPNARVTTGPGLPTWTWNRVELAWSGPVGADQALSLMLMPPWLVSAFGFARVAALAALLLCVLGLRPRGGRGAARPSWLRARGGAAAASRAALLAPSAAAPARADFPSKELLDELRAALLQAPDCAPHCATIPRLRVDAERAFLTLRLEVDAAADTAVPLPGGARSWEPSEVLADGAPARALLRDANGVLWLRVSRGRHQVVARGPLPDRDSIELPLPMQPLRVEATSREWQVHGLREDGLAESALQLTRERDEASAKLEPGALPPFLYVTRELHLDLEWQVQTRVRRATPRDSAVLVEVPLIAGESVASEGIRVRDGRALVSLAPGEDEVSWSSQLEQRASLALSAPEGAAWSEVWRLDASLIWHVEASGIPPIHADAIEGERWREWRPWPGESLRLDVTRPAGVEGATLTIDSSLLALSPGPRSTAATLTLQLRSSRGGRHEIELPEGATLQRVAIDGALQPIHLEGRRLALPIHPGAQAIEVAWLEARGFEHGVLLRTPAVDLGSPSVNAQISLEPSFGRWMLALGGPEMGPVVLFWSILAALAALALGLSRLDLTPLRFHEWLLLGVGLTQLPIAAAAVVAAWLLALGWRGQRGSAAAPGRWFDLLQLGLVALSAAALLALLLSIQRGLLGTPEMQIAGNGSSSFLLRWYQDRAAATPEQAWLLSVPLLAYRIAMLAWALWLAQALLRWLRWGWQCFTAGELWRPLRAGKRADRSS